MILSPLRPGHARHVHVGALTPWSTPGRGSSRVGHSQASAGTTSAICGPSSPSEWRCATMINTRNVGSSDRCRRCRARVRRANRHSRRRRRPGWCRFATPRKHRQEPHEQRQRSAAIITAMMSRPAVRPGAQSERGRADPAARIGPVVTHVVDEVANDDDNSKAPSSTSENELAVAAQ